ncbi:MAG: glycosyltransferase [Pseudomonadota bacterium]
MSAPENPPLVSVVMANHNGAAYLEAAITSVLRQSLAALELIVVDDASTDASKAIIAAAAGRDPRVKPLLCTQNAGAGAARNRALDVATGRYIAVVDADDLVHPGRLARLVDYAEAEAAPIVADDLIHFSVEGAPPLRLFSDVNFDGPTRVSVTELLDDQFMGRPNQLGYLKPLIRRADLGAIRYRDDLPVGEDFDLLLRLAAKGHDIHILPEAWYLYRRHAGSVSYRLGGGPARAMAKAMCAFRDETAPQTPGLAASLNHRIDRMTRSAREAEILDAVKAGHLGSALSGLLRHPGAGVHAIQALGRASAARVQRRRLRTSPQRPLLLVGADTELGRIPASWDVIKTTSLEQMSPQARAELCALTADENRPVLSYGDLGEEVAGFVPNFARVQQFSPPLAEPPVVHVRTPTYKRPDMLRRALACLQAQTLPNWVCDVFDDDPDMAGQSVVAALGDARIRYHSNRPQRLASRNIDQCYAHFNPHRAQYFYVLEDDNQILPRFFEDNIALCERHGVNVLLRNQLVEHASGTADARLSDIGLLEEKLPEGRCPPDVLHLSVMADMGVSNGGIFWSAEAKSDLEIGVDCNATFQEYLRTIAITEPVYVALEPLAVWAENGAQTVRNMGDRAGWLRRELNLKRSVQIVQRKVWAQASPSTRRAFLDLPALRYPPHLRATGLVKSLSDLRVGSALPPFEVARLVLRGMLIRLAGRPMRGLESFVTDRTGGRPLNGANARP